MHSLLILVPEPDMRTKKLVHEGCTIHKEKPFVYVLSSRLRTERCDYCLKK